MDLAAACYRQVLASPEPRYFSSSDAGLRSYKARHNLAVVCRDLGEIREAEEQWRLALSESPGFAPARAGLADLYLNQSRWEDVQALIKTFRDGKYQMLDADILSGRLKLARKEFESARSLFESIRSRHPQELAPRVYLSHVLLKQANWAAAEAALLDILQLAPDHPEARQNLERLRGRGVGKKS